MSIMSSSMSVAGPSDRASHNIYSMGARRARCPGCGTSTMATGSRGLARVGRHFHRTVAAPRGGRSATAVPSSPSSAGPHAPTARSAHLRQRPHAPSRCRPPLPIRGHPGTCPILIYVRRGGKLQSAASPGSPRVPLLARGVGARGQGEDSVRQHCFRTGALQFRGAEKPVSSVNIRTESVPPPAGSFHRPVPVADPAATGALSRPSPERSPICRS